MTYLCIIDDSHELETAIRYASDEARQHKADVAFLYAIEPVGVQQWAGVEDIMRQENRINAEQAMQKWAMVVEGLTGARPVLYIIEGKVMDALNEVLTTEHIDHLVLASSTGDNPIIQQIVCSNKHAINVPLTIVPYLPEDQPQDA